MSSVVEKCEGGFTFIWRIENFRHCAIAKGSYLESASFFMSDLNVVWVLKFYPQGTTTDARSRCDLKRTTWTTAISFHYEICICTNSGEKLFSNKLRYELIPQGHDTSIILFDKLIDNPFPHDTLVLHCHLMKTNLERTVTPVYCHALTQIKIQKKMFFWKIANFSSLLLKRENVFTLMKVEQNSPTLTFKLSLRGTTIGDASIQIVIHFEGVSKRTFFTCSISLVDHSAISTKFMNDEAWLESGEKYMFFPHFLNTRELMANKAAYLPDDVLSLKCEVTLSDGSNDIAQVIHGQSLRDAVNTFQKRQPSLPQIEKEGVSNTLRADLGLFCESGALSDFELSAGGRAFPVHRLILSARSPVFRAMFDNEMLEKATTSLDIPDMDSDTLDRMVRYVYTDAVTDLDWKDTARLYFAADKYQLLGLRRQCSSVLCDILDVSNAAEILALAERHQDLYLKGAVQNFVFNRGRAALNADEWKLLEAENPQLALEALRYILYEIVLTPSAEIPSE